jgi:glycosyltransferase involved in cell wall biosynthesis
MSNRLSVIVPFHRGLSFLERSLAALASRPDGTELVVAADGAVDDCHALAARYGARVVEIEGPRGPAVARNRAAAVASGDILVFVDSDVVVTPGMLGRLLQFFDRDPGAAAVFGAYDDTPGDPGFVSQYKNLAHAFIHRNAEGQAQTFWAGFGAVRRTPFDAVGGFDERFTVPSVEDIDLGYRLTIAGFRVMLEPWLTACHLKRWTVRGMIASDVRDRGIPWTQLMLRYGRMNSNLNVKSSARLCVVLAYLTLAAMALAIVDVRAMLVVPIGLAALFFLDRDYYLYFLRERGFWFGLRVFPLHFLYHLYNGISFATGSFLFLMNRRLGVRLAGALPADAWGAVTAMASNPLRGPGRTGAESEGP